MVATGLGGDVRRSSFSPEPDCAIAQSLGVIGDGWELLIVRDLARGLDRFDQLADSLHISRKVLTERLTGLVDSGIVERSAYQDRPARYAYRLTPRGRALLPVLVALQDWGDRWLLGDGRLTATAAADGAEHARVHALTGTRLPEGLELPCTQGENLPVVSPDAHATVLFTYPGTGVEWGPVPGAAGCALENRLFRDAWPGFRRTDVDVRGVSTQFTDEQQEFAHAEVIPFPLLSDAGHQLTAALRLPTFRAAGRLRHKRLILVIDAERTVRHALFPVVDIPHAVDESLRLAAACVRP